MKLVIPFSHKDINQARRLLLWLNRLDDSKYDMILVASQRAMFFEAGKQVAALASELFDAEIYTLPTEDERGWPWSATHMFQSTLRHVKEDLFWLEPDCVPLRAGWFDELTEAFELAGTTFVGRFVDVASRSTVPNHMSGCAFYGCDWPEVVPTLATPYIKGGGAWDVDFSDGILSDFTSTELIHHMWKRPDPTYRVKLADVEPQACLFHQCKTGELMAQIDREFTDWSLTMLKERGFIFGNMPRYFLTKNASKIIYAGGKPYHFEPVTYFPPTSSFWGVFTTEDESIGLALETAAQAGFISQISKEVYDEFVEKKKPTPVSLNSSNLNAPKRPLGPDVLRSANVLVVDGADPKPPIEVAVPVSTAETSDEVLAVTVLAPEKETLPRKSKAAKKSK